jgi:hypothetical protein
MKAKAGITIKPKSINRVWSVYLGNRKTGEILRFGENYQYHPTGSKTGGIVYMSLTACVESLV